jgi:hypothetical protein
MFLVRASDVVFSVLMGFASFLYENGTRSDP